MIEGDMRCGCSAVSIASARGAIRFHAGPEIEFPLSRRSRELECPWSRRSVNSICLCHAEGVKFNSRWQRHRMKVEIDQDPERVELQTTSNTFKGGEENI